jgi:hypothetical protein
MPTSRSGLTQPKGSGEGGEAETKKSQFLFKGHWRLPTHDRVTANECSICFWALLLLNNDGRIALPPFGCTTIEVYLYLNGVRPNVWYLDERLTDRTNPLKVDAVR